MAGLTRLNPSTGMTENARGEISNMSLDSLKKCTKEVIYMLFISHIQIISLTGANVKLYL